MAINVIWNPDFLVWSTDHDSKNKLKWMICLDSGYTLVAVQFAQSKCLSMECPKTEQRWKQDQMVSHSWSVPISDNRDFGKPTFYLVVPSLYLWIATWFYYHLNNWWRKLYESSQQAGVVLKQFSGGFDIKFVSEIFSRSFSLPSTCFKISG